MRTVTALELRGKMGELLDAASAGERILIERDHRPLAYLISVEDAARLDPDREELLARRIAAMDRLMALGERMRETHPDPLDGLTTAEWIQEDRRRRTEQIAENARRGPSEISEKE